MSVFLYIPASEEMKQADLTSQINGNRTVFTVPESFSGGSLRVYYNGVRQVTNETFSETSDTQFSLTFTPQIGDFLTIDYQI